MPNGENGTKALLQAAMADAGVNVTLISAGEFKVEGNPYQPLSADALQFMQSRIDDYYGAFTRGVAKGRKVPVEQVRSDMGKGRVFGADAAKAANMVDGAATFDEVIARMQRNIKASSPRASRLAKAQRDLAIMG